MSPLSYAEFDAVPNKQTKATEKPSDPLYEEAAILGAIEKRRRKSDKRLKLSAHQRLQETANTSDYERVYDVERKGKK